MTYLHDIDPIALHLGPVQVHWYGVTYMLGFIAAWLLGRRRIHAGRLPGIGDQGFGDMLFYAMLGVVLGGRIGYIVFYAFGDFIRNPLMILRIWEGGMSFHGGLLGVMLGVWLWCRKQGVHFMDAMDFLAPLVPPGLGFGRLGNFINGELWGKLTHAGWGVVFPHAPAQDPIPGVVGRLPALDQVLSMDQIRQQYAQGLLTPLARHPSQLYQAVLEGLVVGGLLWWYSSKPRPRYAVGGMFALLYGLQRFLVEFVRVPDEQLGYQAWGWLTRGQELSLPLIALGLFWLWWSRRQPTLQPVPAAA